MIQLQDIQLSVNTKALVTGLNLEVAKGEKLLITGESGSGKTSLFKAMLGFFPVQAGQILIGTEPLNPKTIRLIRQKIFYLSQDVDLRNDRTDLLVQEILLANHIENEWPGTTRPLMDLLNFTPEIWTRHVHDLSGGERQRLGLMIGFLLDRPIWLLDEPTSALDDTMKQKISDHILKLDKTVLIISHDSVWQRPERLKTYRWG